MCVRHIICLAYWFYTARGHRTYPLTLQQVRYSPMFYCIVFVRHCFNVRHTIRVGPVEKLTLKYCCNTISINPSTSERGTLVTIHSTSVQANDSNYSTLPYYTMVSLIIASILIPLECSYSILPARLTSNDTLPSQPTNRKGSSLVSCKNK